MKVPSTSPDYGAGVVTATTDVLSSAGAEPEAVVAMLHGTTVATNAVLSMSGVRSYRRANGTRRGRTAAGDLHPQRHRADQLCQQDQRLCRPYFTGAVKSATGSFAWALLAIAIIMAAGMVALLTVGRRMERLDGSLS